MAKTVRQSIFYFGAMLLLVKFIGAIYCINYLYSMDVHNFFLSCFSVPTGILLLAELLQRLASKPLNDAVIRSLIGFFTERLVSALLQNITWWKILQHFFDNIFYHSVCSFLTVFESGVKTPQYQLTKCLKDHVARLSKIILFSPIMGWWSYWIHT